MNDFNSLRSTFLLNFKFPIDFSNLHDMDPKYHPYTYLVVYPSGVARYVNKADFEAIDKDFGFYKRQVSSSGHHILGYIQATYPERSGLYDS